MTLPQSVTVTWTADGLVIEPNEPPPITPPTPGTGVQAKRIADLIESFGVNTFSSLDEHNIWGSWPADYQPASVIAALRYIVGDSGFALRVREYHYAGRYEMQSQWLPQIVAAFPGTRVAICPGANATPSDVSTMFALASDPATGIAWIEGLNEPNTDFGSGEVPVDTTMDIQRACWAGRREGIVIMGPSIVAGMPHPEGWITGYCGEYMDECNASMHEGNGHYYPPAHPDIPSTGWSINEYVGGLAVAYAGHAIHLTEYHPTLFNNEGHKPDQPGWDGERDACYTLTTLLRCGKEAIGLWWYALFDYGEAYRCGLFPISGGNDPRPAADALRALCAICADGDHRHGFTPGTLDIELTGLTPAMDYDVYQASDGRFLVPIWHSAEDSAAPVKIEVVLSKRSSVDVYNPLDGPDPISHIGDTAEVSMTVPPGVFVLAITS